MKLANARDLVAGALIAAVGFAIAAKAGLSYDLGSVRRMGPGMFPLGLGLLLMTLGTITALSGLAFESRAAEVRPRPVAAVLAGIACFALLIGPFGLVPAIIGVVMVSSLAEQRVSPVSALLLGAVLAGMAVLIFRVALRLPIDLLNWPF